MNKSSCFKLLAQYVPTCQIALYELYLLIYISITVSLVVCHILFISYISLQIYLDYIFLWMLPWFLLLVRGRTQCIGRSAPSIFRLTVPVISLFLLLLLLHLFLFSIFYFLARIIDCSITLLLPCRYILRSYIQGVLAKILHFFLQTS